MIELMVAMTLSLIACGAIIAVFVGSRTAYQSTAGIALAADGGRFALDTIEESVRGAGFLACATTQLNQSLINNLASPMAFTFTAGFGGFEAAGTGTTGTTTLQATPAADGSTADWNPSLDAAFVPATNQQVKGSDILVLHSSVPQTSSAYTTTPTFQYANSFVVAKGTTLQARQLAVISDCTKAVTFQISSITSGSPATVSIAGATGAPGNTAVSLPLGFAAGALVTPITTTIYYIGVGADGDSALKRLEIVNGVLDPAGIFTDEEIAPDVENMQVLYGLDTNGTRTASAYVTADQVTDFTTVVSVRVAVLAASSAGSVQAPTAAPTYALLGTTVKAPIDTRLRRVFETTITARSAVN
jgi:type IV pilus assembly protein PilW